jgi:uncharacterized protein (TIGR02145 family)
MMKTKPKTEFYLIISLVLSLLIICNGCKKDDDDKPGNPTNGRTKAVFNNNLTYGTMTDQDGNRYRTITIGTQTWMAENLRTTKYLNGDNITLITENTAWRYQAAGAYCNVNNTENVDTVATMGRLYNWYAVSDSRNIAPEGWHIPSRSEWNSLVTHLGGADAGDLLKETGTIHWISPNSGATNESGFTAIPGGDRSHTDGKFYDIGTGFACWSSEEYSYADAYYRSIVYNFSTLGENHWSKQLGLSVRCIKD